MKITKLKEIRNFNDNKLIGYLVNDYTKVYIEDESEILKTIKDYIANGGEVEPAFTEEEKLKILKQKKIKELNNIRDTELKNLKVKFALQNGQEVEFDADETSQTRLSRALNALKDDEKIAWIGTDYKIYELTKEDCYNGLRVAGELQTQLFAKCAELKAKVLQAQTEDEVKAVVWS